MSLIDVMEEEFEVVDVLDLEPALFTEGRVDKSTLPDGVYAYEMRHSDDDDSLPATIESSGVQVNFFGTLITDEALSFDEEGVIACGEDDFGYLDDQNNVKDFFDL